MGIVWFTLIDSSVDTPASRQKRNDTLIAEQMAYHAGVLAYVYGYPLVDMYRQMHNEIHQTGPGQQVYAPQNRFYHFPNDKPLYYTAWFDIGEEPLLIHRPDSAAHDFTVAITNFYADVEFINWRTGGMDEAWIALVAAGWDGPLPVGVRPVEVETPRGWLLVRVASQDIDDTMGLLEDLWLTPLSQFDAGKRPPEPESVRGRPLDPMSSLGFFEVMNLVLRRLPERPGTEALLAQFDSIGIGPNTVFDLPGLSPARKRGLERAVRDGSALIEAATLRGTPDNKALTGSENIGRDGFDYLHRAALVKDGRGNLPGRAAWVISSAGPEVDFQ